MLISFLIFAAIIIAVLLIYVSTKPKEFRYMRSSLMSASPAVIFPHVNNLQQWHAWSPWVKMDPQATYSFSGPAEGNGAVTTWVGKKTGEGRMTIMESKQNEDIKFKLEFFKPMKAVNTAEFTFTPEGDKTFVRWSMYGPNTFMGKVMSLFMDCEKMVGGQFEQGLADLKKIVEAK